MIKGIRIKWFNQHLKNLFPKIRSFPVALTKQLSYCAIPTHVDETLNLLIIHGGCNGVGNRAATEQSIANNIINFTNKCRNYGVNELFISSIICRKNNFLNGGFLVMKLILLI